MPDMEPELATRFRDASQTTSCRFPVLQLFLDDNDDEVVFVDEGDEDEDDDVDDDDDFDAADNLFTAPSPPTSPRTPSSVPKATRSSFDLTFCCSSQWYLNGEGGEDREEGGGRRERGE